MITGVDLWEFFQRFVLTGGGAAAIAYGLFKWLGAKWIEDKFAQRLEQQRHDNAKDLAELKVRWDTDLQGKLKYQEREFRAIPEVWEKLANAFNLLAWLTSSYQEYADVEIMNDAELEQFLKTSEFLETQKQEMRIREGRHRSKYYQFTIFFHRYAKVEAAVREFSVCTNLNFLFLPEDLLSKFGKLSELMYEALSAVKTGRETETWSLVLKAGDLTSKTIRPLFEEAQREIKGLMAAHRS